MKRIIIVFLSVIMLLIMTSCNTPESKPYENTISIATLTAEQQSIIDLFSIRSNYELLIFDYNTDESFRQVEIWVEVYESGELVDRPAGLITAIDSGGTRNGQLAIIINQNDKMFQWTLSMVESGGRYSHVGTAESAIGSELGRAFGPMNDPTSIEDGKEIIIYSSTFQAPGIPHHAFDAQTLQEQPELLLEYPYAHLIKVIFTR